jgi:hypothetical protein
MNDILHDVSPYVVSQPCPQYCALSIVAPQYAPFSCAPTICFVELDIFESNPETMPKRSPKNPIDPPNYGKSFPEGRAGFNQFRTMEGTILGS